MLSIAVPQREIVLATNRRGNGFCHGHFGELLQGAFSRDDSIVRGLITLPCSMVGSKASAIVSTGEGRTDVALGHSKVVRLVQAYRRFHRVAATLDIRVEIDSTIPVGIGMGSSTSDIVATVRALDKALGIRTATQDVANLALSAELASDSTMHADRMMIFAQRSGEILEDYGVGYPQFTVQGFVLDPGSIFDTDATRPARYQPEEIEFFDEARDRLHSIAHKHDLPSLAAIASRSADINQRYHPQRRFHELIELARCDLSVGCSSGPQSRS